MTKYFSVFEIINNMPQQTELTKGTFFYSIGEAEHYLENEWYKQIEDKRRIFTIMSIYRDGIADDDYKQTRERITNKYNEL